MMMRSGIIALATLLAALLMAGCATTEDKKAQTDRDALCSVLDTNHDGKISQRGVHGAHQRQEQGVGSLPEVRHR